MREFALSLLDHKRGEVAGIQRGIADAFHDERDRADVVEMSVGDDDGAHAVFPFLEIFGVGKDVVDARRIFFLELEAGVDDDDVIADLDDGHILADLLHSSERNDADALSDRRNDVLSLGACCTRGRRSMAAAAAAAIPTAALERICWSGSVCSLVILFLSDRCFCFVIHFYYCY